MSWVDRTVEVDSVVTHYLEAGEGFPLVLLHGGAPGDCAEASWERNVGPLSERYRVLAPDWLGFGGTDKLRDFGDPFGRPVRHLARLLAELRVEEAHFAGLSMGGTFLVRSAAGMLPALPVRRLVLVSGGGFSPDNEARRALQAYDGTLEALRETIRITFHDERFAQDEEFVRRRHEWSLVPGAWEHAASMGLRSPAAPPGHFGAEDPTPYEQVSVPTLVTAGAKDPLRLPGYAEELAARIQDAEAIVYERCGHCPNIERADEWNAAVLEFLGRA